MSNPSAPQILTTGRKRVVSACTACYLRKQKCNRQFPCNHCSRRRRTEQCTYSSGHPSQFQSRPQGPQTGDDTQADVVVLSSRHGNTDQTSEREIPWMGLNGVFTESKHQSRHAASLSEAFGYFEYSDSNTLGLLQKLGLHQQEKQQTSKDIVLPQKCLDAVQNEIKRMPTRSILDFLLKFFVADVNWMSQLIHSPSFMYRYECWWNKRPVLRLDDVEFAVLTLRVCLLASQFLPSPSYTIDTIRGVPLTHIRDTCCDIANKLATISASVHLTGSLIRLQYTCLTGLNVACEGRAKESWEVLSSAIHMAQGLGYHKHATDGTVSSPYNDDADELEQEMGRRTFYNLYIWDNLLSRQLDRVSFMKESFCAQVLPNVQADVGHDRAPEGFTERLLQVRLAAFWKDVSSQDQQSLASAVYDPAMAEERYEKLCTQFLADLPAPFALHPATNKEWDKIHPILPLQRQLLHITIFESICHNFKSLLMLDPSQVRCLPAYKQSLISSQTQKLALAAVNVLDAVSTLQVMLGTAYTRYANVTFYIFEAAVLLMSLYISRPETLSSFAAADPNNESIYSPQNTENNLQGGVPPLDPIGWAAGARVGLERCMQAAQDALARLEMLAEISITAETGAYHLAQLVDRAKSSKSTIIAAAAPLNMRFHVDEVQMNWSSTHPSASASISPSASASASASTSTLDNLVNATSSDFSNGFTKQNWESFGYCQDPFGEMLRDLTWSEDQSNSKDNDIILAIEYTDI